MTYFPFFKDIKGANGLIIGGGKVALRKAEKLLPYGPRLTVIAPEILPEFMEMDVSVVKRVFHHYDITPNLDFVIAASDDGAQNERIYRLCREQNVPVNVADRPEYCTFIFPALVKRGNLSVGISTSGASPSAAVWLKEKIEALLPEHMEEILVWLQEQREVVKERIDREEIRSRCLKRFFDMCMEMGEPLEDEQRDRIIAMETDRYEK